MVELHVEIGVGKTRDDPAGEIEGQETKPSDAAFERRAEDEQRPHVQHDVPPPAMHERPCDKWQVVMRVEARDLRPLGIEIAPGYERVVQRKIVGSLRTEALLVKKNDGVRQNDEIRRERDERYPDRIFKRKHDPRPASQRQGARSSSARSRPEPPRFARRSSNGRRPPRSGTRSRG